MMIGGTVGLRIVIEQKYELSSRNEQIAAVFLPEESLKSLYCITGVSKPSHGELMWVQVFGMAFL